MLKKRQSTENSLIELESIKNIMDFLLDKLKRGRYMRYGLRMLHPTVVSEVPVICKY